MANNTGRGGNDMLILSLVEDIEACMSGPLAEMPRKAIIRYLGSLEEDDAKAVVDALCQKEKIPSNVLGALKKLFSERKTSYSGHGGSSWSPPVGKPASPEGHTWFCKAMAAIIPHMRSAVAARDPKNGRLVVASRDAWEKKGRPEHWVGVNDLHCHEVIWEKACQQWESSSDGRDNVAAYHREFYDALMDYRKNTGRTGDGLGKFEGVFEGICS